jgi:muramidase (phage lysozyme)
MLKEFFDRWIGPFDDNVCTESATATDIASPASPTANPAPANAHDVTPQTDDSASNGIVHGSTPAAENSSTQAASSQPQADQNEKAKCITTGCLDLRVDDWHGHPIAGLEIKVVHDKATVFAGKTGTDGSVPTITGLRIGGQFEIRVKRDSGDYKFAAIGTVVSDENAACLASPKTRFEFSTEPHTGAPGTAEQRKQQVVNSHNQKPTTKPEITGNPDKKPEVKMDRDKNGHPKASIVDGLRNWYNRNADNSGAPVGGVTDIERVKRLIEFAKKQTEWKYDEKLSSGVYIKRMHDRTFSEPAHKPSTEITHYCNKYVKIALWYAYHEGEDVSPIGAGIDPAKEMGPALLKAGFVDITCQIPDARWAAPGDVIVYQDKRNSQKAGHIDIRTCDGYISDFVADQLPIRGFKVTGVFRKCYDAMPDRRVRAFLKTIQSRETKGIPENQAWYALNTPIDHKKFAADLSKHPWIGRELPDSIKRGKSSTASGAYQITLTLWRDAVEQFGAPNDFSSATQDIIAVIKFETRGALGHIRSGNIAAAVAALRSTWVSLPGGSQTSDTMEKFERDYNQFLSEIK